ncbi:MAG: winged helix-turn-helix transcriptional regulator [Asgard group archaeon]|nr:winged helix-turn-helix transcriptional regulator [Asgard group archaeon]
MKRLKFIKPKTETADPSIGNVLEVLFDPIRSRIVFEIIFKGEVTAEKLVEITKKSRSTISHHLKKLVENGLVDVFMNPTGKIKFYRLSQNIADHLYTLDEESLLASPLEERSSFVLELQQFFAIINHIFANTLTDQIKKLEQQQPFEDVFHDERTGDLSYTIKGKSYPMPYHSSLITGEEEGIFLMNKIREVMGEFNEKFGDPEKIMEKLKEGTKYLFKAQIFPYLDIED